MAIGCTHGILMDENAFQAVLRFKDHWKPERRFHLGDVGDYAAFRSGAPGTKDEAASIGPDISSGARIISEFAPTDVLIGNHDDRIRSLMSHHNAILAMAAGACWTEFLSACEKVKVKRLIDHYDINRSWIELGDTISMDLEWVGRMPYGTWPNISASVSWHISTGLRWQEPVDPIMQCAGVWAR